MIITDTRVLEYIEGFEKMKEKDPRKKLELSPEDQKRLYTIIEMFSIDKIFQLYISFIIEDYAIKYTTLKKEEFQKTLTDIISFIDSFNKKEA